MISRAMGSYAARKAAADLSARILSCSGLIPNIEVPRWHLDLCKYDLHSFSHKSDGPSHFLDYAVAHVPSVDEDAIRDQLHASRQPDRLAVKRVNFPPTLSVISQPIPHLIASAT